jgi:predicted N-acetyltransferase YhbS
MSVTIHLLSERPEALPQVASWLFSEWGHLTEGNSLEKTVIRLQKSLQCDQMPLTLVACNGKEPLGTVSLIEIDMTTRPELTPWLASLYVEKEFRKKGVASLLIESVLEEAKKLNIPKLYLFTHDQQNFYSHRGWIKFEDVEYRKQRVTIMTKEIATIPSTFAKASVDKSSHLSA